MKISNVVLAFVDNVVFLIFVLLFFGGFSVTIEILCGMKSFLFHFPQGKQRKLGKTLTYHHTPLDQPASNLQSSQTSFSDDDDISSRFHWSYTA